MDEFEALQVELEHYRAEKQRIRDVIGQIGGRNVRKRRTLINVLFLAIVCVLFAFDVVRHLLDLEIKYLPPTLLLEGAVLLVSLKIIWMIHLQSKVDHFQFWILNTIEFRINQIALRMENLESGLLPADGAGEPKDSGTASTDPP